MTATQPILAEDLPVNVNIRDNQGQIAIGHHIVQIGSNHGVVILPGFEQQPHLRPRSTPVWLRPRPFPNFRLHYPTSCG